MAEPDLFPYDIRTYPTLQPVHDCSGIFSRGYTTTSAPKTYLISEEEFNRMYPNKAKVENPKIYIDRDESKDKLLVTLDRLEPTDTFRVFEDPDKKIYIMVDVSDVIDEDTVDEDSVYAIDVQSAKIVELSKKTKVFVYRRCDVRLKLGECMKEGEG